ncbi:MAG: phosphoglycerate kinase, partial [Methylocella sp.]
SPVGKSLCEHGLAQTARDILETAKTKNCVILLPVDVVVAEKFEANAPNRAVGIADVKASDMILDLGPKTIAAINKVFDAAKTLVWNGPLGAFERSPFDAATVACAKHAGLLTRAGKLASIAGGGDTVAALNHARVADDFTYISTAGGAFFEWLEGKALPGVKALEETK